MTRTTRSSVRHANVDISEGGPNQPSEIMATSNSTVLPQRSSSRAPSMTADPNTASSATTGEDADMQNGGDFIDREGEHSEEAMRSLSAYSKELITAIRKLESLHIDTAVPLPKFVVVGDQSHGKSSIVEAICGISMPRSAGTCTRCPFRITTTASRPGERWSCKITLQRRHIYSRNSRKWTDASGAEDVPFTAVTNPAKLGDMLRLAQIAVLNPHLDPATLLHVGPPDQGNLALSFSFNAIDLHITGEDLPELSIVDLPGSVNVMPDQSEAHLVDMIEILIKRYVEDDKALILLVASMDQDLETSTAFRFIGSCKAIERSMGVMTKPDLLVKGRFEYVRRILNGETFKLAFPWYIAKNSTQEDLDRTIKRSEARRLEDTFFENAPWSTNLSDYKNRFGTKQLQNAISRRLVWNIENALPDIIARVEERLAEVTRELNNLPQEPVHPSQIVIEEVQKLARSVEACLQGDDNHATFRAEYKNLIRAFRTQLYNGRPQVTLATPGYVKPTFSIDSDDSTMSDAPTPSKRKRNDGRATPASTPSRSKGLGSQQEQRGERNAAVSIFTLCRIRSALEQTKDSDMPDQVDPRVVKRFIRQTIAPWKGLTEALLKDMHTCVSNMLIQSIAKSLASRNGTALVAQIGEIVGSFHEEVHAAEVAFISHLLACETHKPITFQETQGRQTSNMKAKLREDRLRERIDEHFDTLQVTQNAVPVGDKRKAMAKDAKFLAMLGPDEYEAEVSAMASPIAYYALASGRLLDTVANHLEYGIMHRLETKLMARLLTDLKVGDVAHCAQLLAEDPAREAQRLRLRAEREKLMKAMTELKALPGKH